MAIAFFCDLAVGVVVICHLSVNCEQLGFFPVAFYLLALLVPTAGLANAISSVG
jgi:hypothetical protein